MMLKRVSMIGLLCFAVAGPAIAAEVPKTGEECEAIISDVTKQFGQKTLSDTIETRVDDLFDKLSEQCDYGEYKEASQTANSLKGLVPN